MHYSWRLALVWMNLLHSTYLILCLLRCRKNKWTWFYSMPNIWASECIHYLNLSIWKAMVNWKSHFKLSSSRAPLFPELCGFVPEVTCMYQHGGAVEEGGWASLVLYSTLCTCHTGSFSCEFFLEPINKNLGELVCLVSNSCHGVKWYFYREAFETRAWGKQQCVCETS